MSPRKLRFETRGYPVRYDSDPDAITRPDIVPASLRFAGADDSNPSIVEHRVHRELAKYPSLPDTPISRDEPTVVDAALQKSMEPPRASETRLARPVSDVPRSETRLARPTPDVPRSETRDRLDSTVPPPRARRSGSAPEVVARREQASQPLVSETEPPMRRQRTWPLVVAASLTTAFAMMLGTSLGDGSLKRAAESIFASPAKPVHAIPPPVSPVTRSRPVSKVAETPRPSVAPVAEESPVPSMRFEDLPVSKEVAVDAKAKRSSKGVRRRTIAPRRP